MSLMPTRPSISLETSCCGHTLAGIHAGYACWNPEASVPALIHAGEEWAFPEYIVRTHSHPHYEFHLQISGSTRWTAAGQVLDVPAGALIAVQGGVPHSFISTCDYAYHFIYCSLDLRMLFEELGLPYEHAVFSRPSFIISGVNDSEPILRTLSNELGRKRLHRASLIRNAVSNFALILDRHLHRPRTPVARQRLPQPDASLRKIIDPKVLLAKRYIDEHLSEKINVDALAQRLNVSRSVLYQRMKRELGISPSSYQHHQRIEQAKRMLEMQTMTITSIALDLGFASSQHFSAAFLKSTGTTPSRYREEAAMRNG